MYRTMFVMLMIASLSFADARPPDLGPKCINPILAFEGLERYPEYEFFLSFYYSVEGPFSVQPRFQDIENRKPLQANIEHPANKFRIYAAPKQETQRLREAKRSIDVDKIEGAISTPFDPPEQIKIIPTKPRPQEDKTVHKFTLTIADGKLTVKPVEATKESESILVNSPVVPMWVIGILVGVAVMLFGVWVGRKSKSFSQPPVNPCSPTEPK